MVSKRKHNKEKRYTAEREEAVTHPPQTLMVNLPNPLPVRQELSPDEKKNETEDRDKRDQQLRTAQRLNWITGGGVAVGLLSLLFVWLSFQQSKQAMEIDQRAWVEYAKPPDAPNSVTRTLHLEAGQPITFGFLLKNRGKTPAHNLNATIFLDILPATTHTPLSQVDNPEQFTHEVVLAGILTPNSDFGPTTITRHEANRSVSIATQAQIDALNTGQAYFVLYGTVVYDDIFGVHHWTKFCDWNGINGSFQTVECTQYNNEDANKP